MNPHAKPVEYIDIPESESPDLVYYSTRSENTHRFAQKLNRGAVRIPMRYRQEGMIRVSRPYVLMFPTYGGGNDAGAVPAPVKAFLNDPQNRSLIRGVITSGNTNFGTAYCAAGPMIAEKCGVPELYRYELLGTPTDVIKVNNGLDQFWQELSKTDPDKSR